MLLKRNNTYYFRWQVPKDLRPYFGYELVRSLHTQCKIEALVQITKYLELVIKIKRIRRLMLLKELTQKNYLEAIESIKQKYEAKEITIGWLASKIPSATIEDEIYSQKEMKQIYLSELNGTAYTPPKDTRPPLLIMGLGIHKIERNQIGNKHFINGKIQSVKDKLSKSGVIQSMNKEGYESKDGAIIDKFRRDYTNICIAQLDRKIDMVEARTPVLEAYRSPKPQVAVVENPLPTMLLSEFIENEFFRYKKSRIGGLSEKAEKDYKIDFTKILAVVENKPLNEYTKADIQECLNKVLLLPVKNRRPYNKMTYAQILDMGEIPEEDIVSLSTADHVKKKLQGIFNTAIDLDLVSKNPADKLDWKAPKKGFGNYTDKEVKVLFEAAQKEDGWKKWLVSIGALSGCRLSEIIQLRKQDLIKDEDTGIHFFNITAEAGSLKTEAANRKVPIHTKLLELGLLEYRDTIKAGSLFEVKDKWATNWYSQFRERCDVARINEKNERRVFHSYRHWVITQARAKIGNLSLIQQVVGHEKISAGATDRYTDEMPMKELSKVIECLDFG